MMSIGAVKSSSSVYAYFTDKDNYYLSDKDHIKEAATWYGKGADILGILNEQVNEEMFLNLLEGRIPTGEQIGQRRDGSINHRPATDLTFSAPKSVSVMALIQGDTRLIEAHNKAVDAVLDKVEALYAEARKTEAGVTSFEKTGNLLIAKFRHTTSREMDPQLHTHGVMINATRRDDGAWRALSSRQKTDVENIEHGFRENIYANQHYLGMVYNSTLAKGTVDNGYTIRITDKHGNFEIEGISQDYLDSMSKRREQIVTQLAEKGQTSAAAAQVAALDSRRRKEEVDMDSLHAYWQADAKTKGEDLAKVQEESQHVKTTPAVNSTLDVVSPTAREAIRDAVTHLSQYNVQFSHGDVIRQAFVFAGGMVEHLALENAVSTALSNKEIVGKAHEYYTTKTLLDTEKAFKTQLRQQKGASFSLDVGRSCIVADTLKNKDGMHVVHVKGLRNEAKLVDEMVKTAEANNLNITVLHHNQSSVNRLQHDVTRDAPTLWAAFKNHFKADLMQTVSHFMQDYPTRSNGFFRRNQEDVMVVLDAQKLAYQDAQALNAMARARGAKLLLFNNTQSTQGFRAGNTIKLLTDNGVAEHTSTTPRANNLVEVIDSQTPESQLVDHYLQQNQVPMVVATTNKRQASLTSAIRTRLQQQGTLSRHEIAFTSLSTKGLSDVEKTKAKFYHKGDYVTVNPFTDVQQDFHVADIDRAGARLTLQDRDGKRQAFSLSDSRPFEVKKAQTLTIATGEQLRLTRNLYVDKQTRFEKNTVLTVTEVIDEGIAVQTDKGTVWLDRDVLATRFVDHGYVVKPHQLTDTDVALTVLEGYQINQNRLGEMSEYAPKVVLFTSDASKATKLLDKQQQSWLATDVATGKVPRYQPIVRTDAAIRHDLQIVADALSGNEKTTAETAVAYAMAKLAEREAGFEMTALLKESLQYAIGQVDSAAVEKVVETKKAAGELFIGERYVTTKAAFELETQLLANNKAGQGAVKPLYKTIPKLSAYLTPGQKQAVSLALSTSDRFIVSQGWAGTGKTTMMNEFRKFAELAGYRVVGLAPTHKAAARLDASMNKDESKPGLPVMTVAKFLTDASIAIDDKTILVSDESSMLSNRMFVDIQAKAIAKGARVIYPGDINQQSAIPSGKPMELSMARGVQYSEMKEIVRQKDSPILKEAIELASTKRTVAALKKLETINPQADIKRTGNTVYRLDGRDAFGFETQSYIEIGIDKDIEGKPMFDAGGLPQLNDLYTAVANDYLTRIPEQRDNTIVVAAMHDSREKIDNLIRIGLAEEGKITHEMPVTRLRSRNMDTAELLHVKNFNPGDVVRFAGTYSVVKRGDHMQVVDINGKHNQLTLLSEDKQRYTINPAHIALRSGMSVHEKVDTSLGIGDRVRLRTTDIKRGWKGGEEYTVSDIINGKAMMANTKGALTVDLGKRAEQHWDHAYTNTTFSVQGDDDKYDIGVIVNDNDRSLLIQLSRASHHAMLYTADKAWTEAQLSDIRKQEAANKRSAVEIMEGIAQEAKTTAAGEAKKTTPTPAGNPAQATPAAMVEKKVTAAELKPLLDERIEELALTLLGEPNKRLSNRGQLRFGGKGSLNVNLRTGQWYSHEAGIGGGAFELIKHELGMTHFNDVMDYAKRFVNYQPQLQPVPVKPNVDSRQQREAEDNAHKLKMKRYAQSLYADSRPLQGTPGERYLKNQRGLVQLQGADVRYLPQVSGKVGDTFVKTPGILAVAFDDKREVDHVQVVRLDNNGRKNTTVNLNKQTYGSNNGQPVVLNASTQPPKLTYVAEGVETGLSVLNVNSRAHVLTVLGISNFNNMKLDALADKVLLCLDNDGVKNVTDATIKAAIKKVDGIVEAVKRIEAAGKEVRVAIPNICNTDFNDVLTQQGLPELKKQLHQVFTVDDYSKMAKQYFTDIQKGFIDKVANFDLAESMKKLRIHTKPMSFKFDDAPARPATRNITPDRITPTRTTDAQQLTKATQQLAKEAAKSDKALAATLTQEQVENIANTPVEKTKGTEKTL